jgi:hypothetical protein
VRLEALMVQAEESIKAGKTLSSDEFWAQVRERAEMQSEATRLQ